MKALLIDPFLQTVVTVDCDGSLAAMYRLLDCESVEAVALDDSHTLWIDEDGLGRDPLNPVTGTYGQRFFVFSGAHGDVKLLAGRGLVLRDQGDDGQTADVSLTQRQIEARVGFPSDAKAATAVAARVASDCFVISTEEELEAARKVVRQREQEIVGLL